MTFTSTTLEEIQKAPNKIRPEEQLVQVDGDFLQVKQFELHAFATPIWSFIK